MSSSNLNKLRSVVPTLVAQSRCSNSQVVSVTKVSHLLPSSTTTVPRLISSNQDGNNKSMSTGCSADATSLCLGINSDGTSAMTSGGSWSNSVNCKSVGSLDGNNVDSACLVTEVDEEIVEAGMAMPNSGIDGNRVIVKVENAMSQLVWDIESVENYVKKPHTISTKSSLSQNTSTCNFLGTSIDYNFNIMNSNLIELLELVCSLSNKQVGQQFSVNQLSVNISDNYRNAKRIQRSHCISVNKGVKIHLNGATAIHKPHMPYNKITDGHTTLGLKRDFSTVTWHPYGGKPPSTNRDGDASRAVTALDVNPKDIKLTWTQSNMSQKSQKAIQSQQTTSPEHETEFITFEDDNFRGATIIPSKDGKNVVSITFEDQQFSCANTVLDSETPLLMGSENIGLLGTKSTPTLVAKPKASSTLDFSPGTQKTKSLKSLEIQENKQANSQPLQGKKGSSASAQTNISRETEIYNRMQFSSVDKATPASSTSPSANESKSIANTASPNLASSKSLDITKAESITTNSPRSTPRTSTIVEKPKFENQKPLSKEMHKKTESFKITRPVFASTTPSNKTKQNTSTEVRAVNKTPDLPSTAKNDLKTNMKLGEQEISLSVDSNSEKGVTISMVPTKGSYNTETINKTGLSSVRDKQTSKGDRSENVTATKAEIKSASNVAVSSGKQDTTTVKKIFGNLFSKPSDSLSSTTDSFTSSSGITSNEKESSYKKSQILNSSKSSGQTKSTTTTSSTSSSTNVGDKTLSEKESTKLTPVVAKSKSDSYTGASSDKSKHISVKSPSETVAEAKISDVQKSLAEPVVATTLKSSQKSGSGDKNAQISTAEIKVVQKAEPKSIVATDKCNNQNKTASDKQGPKTMFKSAPSTILKSDTVQVAEATKTQIKDQSTVVKTDGGKAKDIFQKMIKPFNAKPGEKVTSSGNYSASSEFLQNKVRKTENVQPPKKKQENPIYFKKPSETEFPVNLASAASNVTPAQSKSSIATEINVSSKRTGQKVKTSDSNPKTTMTSAFSKLFSSFYSKPETVSKIQSKDIKQLNTKDVGDIGTLSNIQSNISSKPDHLSVAKNQTLTKSIILTPKMTGLSSSTGSNKGPTISPKSIHSATPINPSFSGNLNKTVISGSVTITPTTVSPGKVGLIVASDENKAKVNDSSVKTKSGIDIATVPPKNTNLPASEKVIKSKTDGVRKQAVISTPKNSEPGLKSAKEKQLGTTSIIQETGGIKQFFQQMLNGSATTEKTKDADSASAATLSGANETATSSVFNKSVPAKSETAAVGQTIPKEKTVKSSSEKFTTPSIRSKGKPVAEKRTMAGRNENSCKEGTITKATASKTQETATKKSTESSTSISNASPVTTFDKTVQSTKTKINIDSTSKSNAANINSKSIAPAQVIANTKPTSSAVDKPKPKSVPTIPSTVTSTKVPDNVSTVQNLTNKTTATTKPKSTISNEVINSTSLSPDKLKPKFETSLDSVKLDSGAKYATYSDVATTKKEIDSNSSAKNTISTDTGDRKSTNQISVQIHNTSAKKGDVSSTKSVASSDSKLNKNTSISTTQSIKEKKSLFDSINIQDRKYKPETYKAETGAVKQFFQKVLNSATSSGATRYGKTCGGSDFATCKSSSVDIQQPATSAEKDNVLQPTSATSMSATKSGKENLRSFPITEKGTKQTTITTNSKVANDATSADATKYGEQDLSSASLTGTSMPVKPKVSSTTTQQQSKNTSVNISKAKTVPSENLIKTVPNSERRTSPGSSKPTITWTNTAESITSSTGNSAKEVGVTHKVVTVTPAETPKIISKSTSIQSTSPLIKTEIKSIPANNDSVTEKTSTVKNLFQKMFSSSKAASATGTKELSKPEGGISKSKSTLSVVSGDTGKLQSELLAKSKEPVLASLKPLTKQYITHGNAVNTQAGNNLSLRHETPALIIEAGYIKGATVATVRDNKTFNKTFNMQSPTLITIEVENFRQATLIPATKTDKVDTSISSKLDALNPKSLPLAEMGKSTAKSL